MNAIDLSQPTSLFANFAKTPIREYARHYMEEVNAEMRDGSASTRVGGTTLTPRTRLTLSGTCDSKAVDDSESRRSFFYQASHPTSVVSDDDRSFSTILDETANSGPSAFMFDPTLDFFGWGKHTSFFNEMLSWAFSWTPTSTRHPYHKYDTPSSSSFISTFFIPSKPIDIPPPVMSKQREKIAPQRLLSGSCKSFFSAAK